MTEPLHPALQWAFEQLSASGARWAMLRMPRSLERVDGDIDVLVHPGDVAAASSELRRAGFLPIAASGTSHPLVTYHVATRTWIHLDITTQVLPDAFGPSARLAAACLGRRHGGDPIWRLDPADEFWSLLAHLAEPGRRPGARHWKALRSAALVADASPVATVLERGLSDGRGALAESLEAVRADDPARLRDALRRIAAPPARWGVRSRLLRLARRPGDLWRFRGISVALLGPDGAGKSTLAHCLRSGAFFPTQVIYMGTGVSGELRARPKPLRLLRGPVLFSLGGIATQWVRYLGGFAERLRGKMVIFDRYTEEALLPPKAHDPLWRQIGRVLRRRLVCPAPELAIVLDVSGSVMFARKGEHDSTMLEAERERYRALVKHLPHVMVIDAQQAQSQVCADAMEAIWRSYARRFAPLGSESQSAWTEGGSPG